MARKIFDHDPGDDPAVTVLQWKLTQRRWKTLAGLVSDARELGSSHDAWQARQEKNKEKQRKKGYRVVEVALDIPATLAWCKAEKKPVTIESFSRYSLLQFAKSGAKQRSTRKAPKA